MADLPISFSRPMIHGLLREIKYPGTGKTQTRREHPPRPRFEPDGCSQPDLGGRPCWWDYWRYDSPEVHRFKLPYAVGDRLYVREHWRCSSRWDGTAPRDLKPRSMTIYFDAGGSIANQDSRNDWRPSSASYDRAEWMGRFRQAMHMPRWASRITLTVTDVRVQRLPEISGEDCLAEGACEAAFLPLTDQDAEEARAAFRTLWDSLHGPDAWKVNPMVAAYTFIPILGNIDQIGKAA